MTPEERAKELYDEIQPWGFEGDPYAVIAIITKAIKDAVEDEDLMQQQRTNGQLYDATMRLVREEREACAKMVEDYWGAPMFGMLATAIRSRK